MLPRTKYDIIHSDADMNREEIVYHLKKRWEKVRQREIAELRETPFEVRFAQTVALMRFAKSLDLPKRQVEEDNVRGYWKKLKGT